MGKFTLYGFIDYTTNELSTGIDKLRMTDSVHVHVRRHIGPDQMEVTLNTAPACTADTTGIGSATTATKRKITRVVLSRWQTRVALSIRGPAHRDRPTKTAHTVWHRQRPTPSAEDGRAAFREQNQAVAHADESGCSQPMANTRSSRYTRLGPPR